MGKCEEFVREITEPLGSGDYWEDEGVVIALELVNELDGTEWERVSRQWPAWSEAAQCRLADLLADVERAEAVAILKKMLEVGSPRLIEQARASIRGR